MKGDPEQRAVRLGEYMVEHRATVRSAAAAFGISKSTVHKDLQTHLPRIDRGLYLQVLPILEENKAQRHIRGGLATRKKYHPD
ncbi:MAG: sporulation transcriptional regulator SpoIIID [Oscillospiraceae bacterium]|nr:sporulation transcriptional regulator SpoIIID [Oscillospiraceae bacterium]